MTTPSVRQEPLANFSLLQMDEPAVTALMTTLASDFDLTRLDKVTMEESNLRWILPGLQGEVMQDALDVIIVGVRTTRAYWETPFQRGQATVPPDCASDTGQQGVGTPGGECATCAFNQFGSDGRGKACREYRELFLMDQEDIFPKLLRVSRTSIGTVGNYLFALAKRKLTEQVGDDLVQRPYIPTDVLTRLTIVQGTRFLQVKLQPLRVLLPEERHIAHLYGTAFTSLLAATPPPAPSTGTADGTEGFPF